MGADKSDRKSQREGDRNAIGPGRKGGWCPICETEIGVCETEDRKKKKEARYFMYWTEDGDDTPYDYIDQKPRTDNRSCGYLCANHDRRIGKANLLKFGYDKATAIKINKAVCSNNHNYWSRYNREYSFNGST